MLLNTQIRLPLPTSRCFSYHYLAHLIPTTQNSNRRINAIPNNAMYYSRQGYVNIRKTNRWVVMLGVKQLGRKYLRNLMLCMDLWPVGSVAQKVFQCPSSTSAIRQSSLADFALPVFGPRPSPSAKALTDLFFPLACQLACFSLNVPAHSPPVSVPTVRQ